VDAEEDEQFTVTVAFAVILVEEIEPQFRPDGTLSVNAIVPDNPLTMVIVIIDFADEPTFTAAGEVAVTVKSEGVPNVKAAVAW
jgi:hypothetical protein